MSELIQRTLREEGNERKGEKEGGQREREGGQRERGRAKRKSLHNSYLVLRLFSGQLQSLI